jgi:hypothetical protein
MSTTAPTPIAARITSRRWRGGLYPRAGARDGLTA